MCTSCKRPLKLEAMIGNGSAWHPDCCKCYNCKKPLTDVWFYMRESAIFCTACYRGMYFPRCCNCNDPIDDCTGRRALDAKWHERCLKCMTCLQPLARYYAVSQKKQVCIDCYKKELSARPVKKEESPAKLGTTKWIE